MNGSYPRLAPRAEFLDDESYYAYRRAALDKILKTEKRNAIISDWLFVTFIVAILLVIVYVAR